LGCNFEASPSFIGVFPSGSYLLNRQQQQQQQQQEEKVAKIIICYGFQ